MAAPEENRPISRQHDHEVFRVRAPGSRRLPPCTVLQRSGRSGGAIYAALCAVAPADTQPNPPPGGQTNPKLTATLAADYEAVRNDLEQAQEVAADYQRMLASKSNDYAHLRTVLERAQHDLSVLQLAIVELRAERHRLANEVQGLYCVEHKYKQLLAEQKTAVAEKESLRRALETAERTIQALWTRVRASSEEAAQPGKSKMPSSKEPAKASVPDEPPEFIRLEYDSGAGPDQIAVVTPRRKPRR
jgi:hypothetical protein